MHRIWKKNQYIDMWTVVHLVWGAMAASVAFVTMSQLIELAVLIFLLASIGWEVAEVTFKISDEAMDNKVLDVVLALGTFYYAYEFLLTDANSIPLLWSFSIVFMALWLTGAVARNKYADELKQLDHKPQR